MNYSITQGTNNLTILALVTVVIKVVTQPDSLTPEDMQLIGLAFIALVTTSLNWLNRHAKGDVNLSGFKK